MSQAVSKRIAVMLFVRLVLVATTLVFFPTHLFAQAELAGLSSIDFGNQQINVESDPITLTLNNIGNNSATGINCYVTDRLGFNDPGMFTAATCPASLAVGASFTVNVTFTPTSVGLKGAQLIVAYHDSSQVTDTKISLDGTGVEFYCGDGVVDEDEDCDDSGESETCDADCTVSMCGDDYTNLLAGEECDDGGIVGGDGCSANCIFELDDKMFIDGFEGSGTTACENDTLDQDETDVDCGGAVCPSCPSGSDCLIDPDCESGICQPGNICQ